MSGKKQNKYTVEFKKTIVNLYHSGKTYAELSSEYGIYLYSNFYLNHAAMF